MDGVRRFASVWCVPWWVALSRSVKSQGGGRGGATRGVCHVDVTEEQ